MGDSGTMTVLLLLARGAHQAPLTRDKTGRWCCDGQRSRSVTCAGRRCAGRSGLPPARPRTQTPSRSHDPLSVLGAPTHMFAPTHPEGAPFPCLHGPAAHCSARQGCRRNPARASSVQGKHCCGLQLGLASTRSAVTFARRLLAPAAPPSRDSRGVCVCVMGLPRRNECAVDRKGGDAGTGG